MNVAHAYRITKYDPAFRDERGHFTRDDWTGFGHIGETFSAGALTLAAYLEVEARYLAVASFVEESGVRALSALGVENYGNNPTAPREGDRLEPLGAVEAVKGLLRGEFWCRLESEGFYVHVGYDYYMYVGSNELCSESVERATALGLFVDHDFPSPWHPEDEGDPD